MPRAHGRELRVWYNWSRIHRALRVTPAMAAGLSDSLLDWANIVELIELEAPRPGSRGAYKRKAADAEPQINKA